MAARWLLHRLGENFGIISTFAPKPVKGDWNGVIQQNSSACDPCLPAQHSPVSNLDCCQRTVCSELRANDSLHRRFLIKCCTSLSTGRVCLQMGCLLRGARIIHPCGLSRLEHEPKNPGQCCLSTEIPPQKPFTASGSCRHWRAHQLFDRIHAQGGRHEGHHGGHRAPVKDPPRAHQPVRNRCAPETFHLTPQSYTHTLSVPARSLCLNGACLVGRECHGAWL